MIVIVDLQTGRCITIHIPMWLLFNWPIAWVLSLILRCVGAKIRARDIKKWMGVIRGYQKNHPDFRMVEVSTANGDHIALWV